MWRTTPLILLLSAPALAGGELRSERTPAAPATPAALDGAPAPWSTFWWGELDGDGVPDAVVLPPAGAARLLRGDGVGGFEDATERAGLAVVGARQALWRDFDGDRKSDLLLVVPGGASRLLRNAGGTLEDVTQRSGLGAFAGVQHAEARDFDADGAIDLVLSTAEREVVLRNRGDGSFEEVRLQLPPRGRAAGGSANASFGPGVTVGGTSPTGPSSPAAAMGICAATILDAILGGCIEASAVPTLGMLYPLSPDLFVHSSGRVGIGTTNPAVRLDVTGDVRAAGRLISTVGAGAPLQVSSGTLVANLNADRLDGLDASAFSQLGNSIGTLEIEDLAVTSAKLGSSAVTTAKIAASAVGSAQIADGSVGTADIANAAVTAAKLAAGAVTSGSLAMGSVGSPEIADGSIVNIDVSPTAAIAGTKISPDFGSQAVSSTTTGSFGSASFNGNALKGESLFGPTRGYLGIQGTASHDGVASANWTGLEIGVAGISTGASATDNYGVLGHSNYAGVRGENAGSPASDYAELGLAGIGLRAAGSSKAAELLGLVDVDGLLTVDGGNATFTTFGVVNPLNGTAGHFRTFDSPGVFNNTTLIANNQAEGGALSATQSNAAATSAAAFISTQSTSSINRALHVVKLSASAGEVAFIDANDTGHTGIVLNVRQRGTGTGLFVDAQGGGVAGSMQATGNVLRLNNTSNVGSILEAANGTDIEFRVDSTGNVFCDGAFTGGGADYAEWLERADPEEAFRPGDVVGVRAGRIAKDLRGASHVLVISTSPALLGNAPNAEDDVREDHEMVAFLGQVPTRVRGPVRTGDLLMPSGRHDGSAVAVAPHALAPEDVSRVFATAWEDADGEGEHLILAGVGIDQAKAAALVVEALHERVSGLEQRLAGQDDAIERLGRQLADLAAAR